MHFLFINFLKNILNPPLNINFYNFFIISKFVNFLNFKFNFNSTVWTNNKMEKLPTKKKGGKADSVMFRTKNIREDYKFTKKLGSGAYGVVY